jgi:hypothetical protein
MANLEMVVGFIINRSLINHRDLEKPRKPRLYHVDVIVDLYLSFIINNISILYGTILSIVSSVKLVKLSCSI